jgi:hypothetical protein
MTQNGLSFLRIVKMSTIKNGAPRLQLTAPSSTAR